MRKIKYYDFTEFKKMLKQPKCFCGLKVGVMVETVIKVYTTDDDKRIHIKGHVTMIRETGGPDGPTAWICQGDRVYPVNYRYLRIVG